MVRWQKAGRQKSRCSRSKGRSGERREEHTFGEATPRGDVAAATAGFSFLSSPGSALFKGRSIFCFFEPFDDFLSFFDFLSSSFDEDEDEDEELDEEDDLDDFEDFFLCVSTAFTKKEKKSEKSMFRNAFDVGVSRVER